jgi:hypothetical protein
MRESARGGRTFPGVAGLYRGPEALEVELCLFVAYWFQNGRIRKRAAFRERREALEAAGLP